MDTFHSRAHQPTRRQLLEGGAAIAAVVSLPIPASATPMPNDRQLWYRQPAKVWTEALPIGNGRLGAMVFGGVAQERLQLNEDTLYAGGPYDPINPNARAALPEVRRLIDAGEFAAAQALANARVMAVPIKQMAYQPVGDLILDLPGAIGAVTDYSRHSNLDSATATTHFVAGGTRYSRDVFASPDDQVIAVQLHGDRPFDLIVGLTSPQADIAVAVAAGMLTLTGRNRDQAGIAATLRFAARARVTTQGGTIVATGDRLRVTGARSVTILVAMATSFRRFDDTGGDPEAATLAVLGRAARRDFDRMRTDAVAAHQALFGRVRLDLGRSAAAELPTDERIRANRLGDDPALAALYFDYGRYLLIASSRAGSQPANLQGIWNDQRSAAVGIEVHDQHQHRDELLAGAGHGAARMRRAAGADGARAGGHRRAVTAKRDVRRARLGVPPQYRPVAGHRARSTAREWGLWPTGGAWLCTHLWDHYDYGRDRRYLRVGLSADARRGAVLPRHAPDRSEDRRAGHQPVAVAGEHPSQGRVDLRRPGDGHADPARPVRSGAAGGGAARHRPRLRGRGRGRAQAAARRIVSARTASCRSGRPTGTPRPPNSITAMSRISTALFPSDQIDVDDTPALAQAARRSLDIRGDEFDRLGDGVACEPVGAGCATASMRTASSHCCWGRSAPIPTCSTRIRRSRSTAISAARGRWRRC